MLSLSEHDIRALEALATYQYLTASQMERLGVGKNRANIRNFTLARLARITPAAVKGYDFGVIPKIGRLERVYHLTERGAKLAADILQCDPSEIVYPKYGLRFQYDYFHRLSLVDFHIGLRKWIAEGLDRELEFFNPYYIKGPSRRSLNQYLFKPSPHLPAHYRKTIEPDGVFRFRTDRNTLPLLCAVEIHRKPDTKYITEQLDRHITAMDQMLIAERFENPSANLVLSVHENLSSFRGVQKRIQEIPDFEPFLPFFHFNLQANARENFTKGWITADESPSTLFY